MLGSLKIIYVYEFRYINKLKYLGGYKMKKKNVKILNCEGLGYGQLKEMSEKLNAVLELHLYMSGAYFYSPPSNAYGRRSYEEKKSLETQIGEFVISQVTQCSCSNVYYSMRIFQNGDGTGKDIRLVKKILNEVNEQLDLITRITLYNGNHLSLEIINNNELEVKLFVKNEAIRSMVTSDFKKLPIMQIEDDIWLQTTMDKNGKSILEWAKNNEHEVLVNLLYTKLKEKIR